jgi:AP-1 complex subunit beta-1
VAKLFDLDPAMCIENGFLDLLQEMLNDPNPMVVANAVQALGEIQDTAPELNAFHINTQIHNKLLVALNECTEYA